MKSIYKGFIDGTDFQHHLEADANGVKVYPSVTTLRKGIGHDPVECGIAEVEIKFVRWVQEPTV